MDESGAGLPKKLKPPFTTAPAESVGSTSGQSRGGAADGGPLDGGGEGNGGRPFRFGCTPYFKLSAEPNKTRNFRFGYFDTPAVRIHKSATPAFIWCTVSRPDRRNVFPRNLPKIPVCLPDRDKVFQNSHE